MLNKSLGNKLKSLFINASKRTVCKEEVLLWPQANFPC